MIKAILFDMDGVLIDSMTHHIDTWVEVFEEENITVSRDIVARNEGLSFNELADSFARNHGVTVSDSQAKKMNSRKLEKTRNHGDFEPFPEVKGFLQFLKKKGIKTALVTGGPRVLADRTVKKDFDNMFNVVVTCDDVQRSKPYPDPYLKAVETLNLKKEECLVIENAPLGIESAKSAGIKVYALETTLDGSYLTAADKVFKNHKDLIKYLTTNDLS